MVQQSCSLVQISSSRPSVRTCQCVCVRVHMRAHPYLPTKYYMYYFILLLPLLHLSACWTHTYMHGVYVSYGRCIVLNTPARVCTAIYKCICTLLLYYCTQAYIHIPDRQDGIEHWHT